LREARRSVGLRQVDVARVAGVSPSWVSQIERGVASDISFRLLAVLLAIVGLDLSVRAYPGGSPLRDEGHRRLLGRVRALLPEGAAWRTEVPLPQPGDQRAWDAMTRVWGLPVGIEAELRPTDLQALERRLALKKRDGGIDRLILVLADTRANRALLRLIGDSVRDSYPIQGRAARVALRSIGDAGGDLLLLA
jgi:transcriptional regulator with XRE-family HTH domain